MKTASIFTFAAALGLATLAMGQVNVIVTSLGVVDDPGVPGTQTLSRYSVTLDNTGPGNITGIDLSLNGTGLYQIQGNGFGNVPQDSIYADTLSAGGAAYVNADTHLSFDAAEVLDVQGVGEGNEGVVLGGDAAHHGTSTFFNSGDSGIVASAQANQLEVLNVVLAPGGSVTLTGFAAVEGETNPRALTSTLIPVPEPASLAVIALGGLMLARRRMI